MTRQGYPLRLGVLFISSGRRGSNDTAGKRSTAPGEPSLPVLRSRLSRLHRFGAGDRLARGQHPVEARRELRELAVRPLDRKGRPSSLAERIHLEAQIVQRADGHLSREEHKTSDRDRQQKRPEEEG